jgi:nucleoside-diphosphate-sugar epimerase
MRVFVTGATGFIGSAIVRELLRAGHQVLGLARSNPGAAALRALGATVHRGSLDDLASLQSGAAAADGVIHTAFIHDFSKFQQNCEIDRRAVHALGAALAGSARPLVVTSGTALVAGAGVVTERDVAASGPTAVPRVASEEAAAAVAASGVRVTVVRLPPTVHGEGDHGFVPMLIGVAREKRRAAYVGDGLNRWPAVHRLDAARLFRLALERASAAAADSGATPNSGAAANKAAAAIWHGVGEEGVAFREIAKVIGSKLEVPVVSKSRTEAAGHFGWMEHFASLDKPASSAHTRQALGWNPTHPGLLADLEDAGYFEVASVLG